MFEWSLLGGTALLENKSDQTLTLRAGTEIGLVRVQARVQQREIVQTAEALITVAGELPGTQKSSAESGRGLPTFTYSHCPGELWRSRFEETHHMVIINSGHRDFIFSSRTQAMRLRYLIRLYTKEIILKNFHGIQALDAMDRLIEVSQLAEQSM